MQPTTARAWRAVFCVGLVAALLVAGCNSGAENLIPPGGSSPQQTVPTVSSDGEGTVGAQGGAVEVADPEDAANKARVEVPPGALAEDTVISIQAVPDAPDFDTSGVEPVGPAIAFGAGGTAFSRLITLKIPYDPALVSSDDLLIVFAIDEYANGDSWEIPTSLFTADPDAGVVTVLTTHLSTWRVGRVPASWGQDDFATDFDPKQHGFAIKNTKNTCGGMASFAKWYFEKHRDCSLFDVDPAVQERIAEEAQNLAGGVEAFGEKMSLLMSGGRYDHALIMIKSAMRQTGAPQLMGITWEDNEGKVQKHMVLVIAYDRSDMLVYDPNVPGQIQHYVPPRTGPDAGGPAFIYVSPDQLGPAGPAALPFLWDSCKSDLEPLCPAEVEARISYTFNVRAEATAPGFGPVVYTESMPVVWKLRGRRVFDSGQHAAEVQWDTCTVTFGGKVIEAGVQTWRQVGPGLWEWVHASGPATPFGQVAFDQDGNLQYLVFFKACDLPSEVFSNPCVQFACDWFVPLRVYVGDERLYIDCTGTDSCLGGTAQAQLTVGQLSGYLREVAGQNP